MKIIVSPAKKMQVCDDHGLQTTIPRFEEKALFLTSQLAQLSDPALQKLHGISDSLMASVREQLEPFRSGFPASKSPALLAYSGYAFRSMSPSTFDDSMWSYVQEHLWILSGMFGVLRPLDEIWPYRLEMGLKASPSLYVYWQPFTDPLFEGETIINLASREYSRLVPASANIINVRFLQDEDGKKKETTAWAKEARGAMVRWMAENRVKTPEELKKFDWLGYHLDEALSSEGELIFVRPRPVPKRVKSR